MKDFDKKFTRQLLKMMSEGERITPAQAKKLQGRLSRANTPEKKKALLTELQQASAPKSKSRAKSPAKAQKTKEVVKVISEVQAEATSRVRAVEEELAILSTLPGRDLPKIEALREIANELKIDISDLGRKKKEMLLRLHAQSGGRLKKFDRLVSRIEAEKKEPNIKGLRDVARRNQLEIPTDLDERSRRGKRKNKAIRDNLIEGLGGRDFEPKFQNLVRRLGVSKGDRISKDQYIQLRDMWADHLTTKYNMNVSKAFMVASRNVCKAFIYAGCRNQRTASLKVASEVKCFSTAKEAQSFAVKLASSCGCAQFVTEDADLGYIVTNNPSLGSINESFNFVAI